MYKRYYDGYGTVNEPENKGEVVIPKESPPEADSITSQPTDIDISHSGEATLTSIASHSSKGVHGGFLGNIELDDIILMGVILLVLKDNPDDQMLVIILATVFLLGFFEK